MAEPTGEKFIGDMVGRIDPADPASLVFSIADYQVFDDELACVTWVYGGDGKQGIVLWNLEPGQENDYHQHPTTEHLHVIIEGTAEYTLDGGAPITVTTGQAVMVPAGVPHGIRNRTQSRCTYMAITGPGQYEKVLVERD
jgi:quercetin dioxygenase-like cupin family protein